MIERPATCGKCYAASTGWAACATCGKRYGRCDAHGGEDGARRSVHSHAALHHPKAAAQ